MSSQEVAACRPFFDTSRRVQVLIMTQEVREARILAKRSYFYFYSYSEFGLPTFAQERTSGRRLRFVRPLSRKWHRPSHYAESRTSVRLLLFSLLLPQPHQEALQLVFRHDPLVQQRPPVAVHVYPREQLPSESLV